MALTVPNILIAAALLAANVAHGGWTLTQDSSGPSFFDNWNFYEGNDVNNTGSVFYVSHDFAVQQSLVFANERGNTVIKVDNTTDGRGNATFLRNSVKILSNYKVSIGDLVLMDAAHIPFGCSLWPAYWTQGIIWPDDGEIDIIENINLETRNNIALHTSNGCTHPPADQSLTSLFPSSISAASNASNPAGPNAPGGQGAPFETGTLLATDCFNATNFDQGCIVGVPSPNSYGPGFAQIGGGVYAFLWAPDGMSFWFWERQDIPSDVPTGSPQPEAWGTPTAFYPNATCDFDVFWKPQTLIFETTICGGFAGSQYARSGCPGTCADVVPVPENYDNAFWEVAYVRVFHQGDDTSSTPNATETLPLSFAGTTPGAPTATPSAVQNNTQAGAASSGSVVAVRPVGWTALLALVSYAAFVAW